MMMKPGLARGEGVRKYEPAGFILSVAVLTNLKDRHSSSAYLNVDPSSLLAP